MNIDCRWIEEKMEAFFCDQLGAQERDSFHLHVESCGQCRQRLEELTSIDPLIKQLFRHELVIATTPRRRRWSILVGAVATAATALIVMIALRKPPAPAPIVLTPVPP